jgi:hypothetical protein
MATPPRRKASPELSRTRTSRDWIMIIFGVFLVILFLAAGYFSYAPTEPAKPRGPVKDPKNMGPGGSRDQQTMPFRISGNLVEVARHS